MPVPNNTFAAKLCPFLMRYIRNMPMMRFMVGSMLFMKKKNWNPFAADLSQLTGVLRWHSTLAVRMPPSVLSWMR